VDESDGPRPLWGPSGSPPPLQPAPWIPPTQPAPPPEPKVGNATLVAIFGLCTFLVVTAAVVLAFVRGGGSPTTSAGAAQPAATTTVTTTATTTATPTTTTATTTTTTTVDLVPAGYRRVTGPAGVQVSIPQDWTVDTGVVKSEYEADDPSGSGSFLRYGGSPTPAMTLLAAATQNEQTNTGIRNGYQRLRLENETTASGDETVAWEFLFTTGDGQQRHALAWFWRADGNDYAVYLSAAAGPAWAALQPVADVLVSTAGPQ
jgi:hypothetical protein